MCYQRGTQQDVAYASTKSHYLERAFSLIQNGQHTQGKRKIRKYENLKYRVFSSFIFLSVNIYSKKETRQLDKLTRYKNHPNQYNQCYGVT